MQHPVTLVSARFLILRDKNKGEALCRRDKQQQKRGDRRHTSPAHGMGAVSLHYSKTRRNC